MIESIYGIKFNNAKQTIRRSILKETDYEMELDCPSGTGVSACRLVKKEKTRV